MGSGEWGPFCSREGNRGVIQPGSQLHILLIGQPLGSKENLVQGADSNKGQGRKPGLRKRYRSYRDPIVVLSYSDLIDSDLILLRSYPDLDGIKHPYYQGGQGTLMSVAKFRNLAFGFCLSRDNNSGAPSPGHLLSLVETKCETLAVS